MNVLCIGFNLSLNPVLHTATPSILIMNYSLPILTLALLAFAGCASHENTASLDDTSKPYAEIDISEPDFISVERFAVTIDEAEAVVSPSVLEAFTGQTPTERELAVGEAYAEALQNQIVAALKARNINAYPSESAPDMTYKTGIIRGFFFEEDEGEGELFGFGLADSDISARLIFFMEEVIIGSSTLTTETDLKSHRAPKESAMSSETVEAIEAAAQLAAEKVADVVLEGYDRRGWSK